MREQTTYAGVDEALRRLTPVPLPHTSPIVARVVGQNPNMRHVLLLCRKPPNFRRAAQQEQAKNTNDNGQRAEEIRHIPPRLELRSSGMLQRTDRIENQARDDPEAGVGALKD